MNMINKKYVCYLNIFLLIGAFYSLLTPKLRYNNILLHMSVQFSTTRPLRAYIVSPTSWNGNLRIFIMKNTQYKKLNNQNFIYDENTRK